jgi:hypothetical protein
MIWGNLLHLSYNMWNDRECAENPLYWAARDTLLFDRTLWDDLLVQMAEAGFNMVVIDLGDGVHWQSHPEIAVQGAWTTGELKAELDKMRALGLEPIPKLNFATAHDAWLKEYSRMVSTPVYYQVCADLIAEASVLFDTPRLFHLGMDEETAENQKLYNMCIVRQHELYWHDFHFLVEQVEKAKVRPWIWSDYVWNNLKRFGSICQNPFCKATGITNWSLSATFPKTLPAGSVPPNIIANWKNTAATRSRRRATGHRRSTSG